MQFKLKDILISIHLRNIIAFTFDACGGKNGIHMRQWRILSQSFDKWGILLFGWMIQQPLLTSF